MGYISKGVADTLWPAKNMSKYFLFEDISQDKLRILAQRVQRDGEYKKRSHLRGICHYRHRGVDAGKHGRKTRKTTEYKSKD
jgi:hypothetical protein